MTPFLLDSDLCYQKFTPAGPACALGKQAPLQATGSASLCPSFSSRLLVMISQWLGLHPSRPSYWILDFHTLWLGRPCPKPIPSTGFLSRHDSHLSLTAHAQKPTPLLQDSTSAAHFSLRTPPFLTLLAPMAPSFYINL